MTNTIYGTNKPDRIALYDGPTEENDDIFGYGGDDVIHALGGNDWIRGGDGADIIDGGGGLDWSDYGDSGEGVHVDLFTHEARQGTAEGDILIRIEGLRGSIHSDHLLGDDEFNDLRGNAGNDYLLGRGGDDWLWGEADNDTLEGGAGRDFLFGGAGIDTASYLLSTAGVAASLLRPGINWGDAAGDSYLSIENLVGSMLGDFLEGDCYDNVIDGFFGGDVILGGAGSDVLHGNWGTDWLFGEDDSDVLIGGDDDDILQGGMNGLTGPDRLIGGSGADRFVWSAVAEMAGFDIIEDFNRADGDVIDVSTIDANEAMFGRQHFVFVGDIGGVPPGPGQISWDPTTSSLVFNSDADAAPEGFIQVPGGGTPNASWFVL